jgi:hypothetical protein
MWRFQTAADEAAKNCSLRTINSRSHLLMSAEPILVTDRAPEMSVRTNENTQGEGRSNFFNARCAVAPAHDGEAHCARNQWMVSNVLMSR